MDRDQADAAKQATRSSACKDRRVLNGTFWVLRSGALWRSRPVRRRRLAVFGSSQRLACTTMLFAACEYDADGSGSLSTSKERGRTFRRNEIVKILSA